MAENADKPTANKDIVFDPVFNQFFDNGNARRKFEAALYDLRRYTPGQGNCLVFLKVTDSDAHCPVSFSEARCSVQEHAVEERPLFATIGAFFKTGLEVLYVYMKKRKVPVNEADRLALSKLLQFLLLSENHEDLLALDTKEISMEWQWAMILTQHLLSKLSLETECRFDQHYVKLDPAVCPCCHQDQLICGRGDTSFGCTNGWRGKIDIMIGSVPVNVSFETDTDITGDGSASDKSLDDLSSIENGKCGNTASIRNSDQMFAQTITYSFLKKQGLIPLIGISSSDFILNFYDSELDILLSSAPLKFRVGGGLDFMVVTMLWLALNYQHFCTGVPDCYTKYRSSFHELVDVGQYQTNTMSPFQHEVDSEACHTDWWQVRDFALDMHREEDVSETMKYISF